MASKKLKLRNLRLLLRLVIFNILSSRASQVLQPFFTQKIKQIHVQVRALIEGQFLSMRAHAERFGMPSPPKRIIATGGGSANKSILNCIASIFGCDVYTVQRTGMWFLHLTLFVMINILFETEPRKHNQIFYPNLQPLIGQNKCFSLNSKYSR